MAKQTVEYPRHGIPFSCKKEQIWIHSTTCMNLQRTMPSEKSTKPQSPQSLSQVQLFATPRPGSSSMGFSRQEYWSGLPFPSPMHESEKWKWSRSAVSVSTTYSKYLLLVFWYLSSAAVFYFAVTKCICLLHLYLYLKQWWMWYPENGNKEWQQLAPSPVVSDPPPSG